MLIRVIGLVGIALLEIAEMVVSIGARGSTEPTGRSVATRSSAQPTL